MSSKEKHQTEIQPLFFQILKPTLIAITALVVSFIILYFVLGYYSIDPGFWNLSILFVEVGVGVIIALIVEKRTDENKTNVNRALSSIFGMINEDYVLRRERKNLISRNLKKNLILLRFYTLKNLELIKLWRNENDENLKKKRSKAVLYGFGDIHNSLILLNETKKVGFDVFEFRAIQNIDYLIDSIEKPVFDNVNNECSILKNDNFFDLIRDLGLFTHRILESDPESFESNYRMIKQMKKEPDGTELPVLAVVEKKPGLRKTHDMAIVMHELMSPTIFYQLNKKYDTLKNLENVS